MEGKKQFEIRWTLKLPRGRAKFCQILAFALGLQKATFVRRREIIVHMNPASQLLTSRTVAKTEKVKFEIDESEM